MSGIEFDGPATIFDGVRFHAERVFVATMAERFMARVHYGSGHCPLCKRRARLHVRAVKIRAAWCAKQPKAWPLVTFTISGADGREHRTDWEFA